MEAEQEHNKIEKKKATSKVLNCLKQQQAATDESLHHAVHSFRNPSGIKME